MPGDISKSNPGPPEESPYVPSWCYPNGPKMCPCGHHEGYHNDKGECLLKHKCNCAGLPDNCRTPLP
jgi:hypothetical protein